MSLDRIQFALQNIDTVRRELARRTTIGFTKYTFPGYETNWHHEVVGHELDEVLNGNNKSLIICLPPQNGKSELVSRRFPAYALGKYPDKRIIAASYGATLATEMSRDVQRIMSTTEFAELFPGTRLGTAKDDEIRSQDAFDIVGRRGKYRSVGVGGGVTGKTADIGIIDDPVKSRAEAESEVEREKVWRWYRDDFRTRLFGDEGAIVILCTRWHEDDLVGRLLKLAKENPNARQWRLVTLPALVEAIDLPLPSYDPRKLGEALWPAKYPVAELLERRVGNEYGFSALYQQRPVPPGGGLFKREWFEIVKALPAECRFVRAWDKAGTQGDGDWTCGVKMAEHKGIFYVCDVIRAQLTSGPRNDLIRQTAALDGPSVPIRLEQEPGSGGKESAEISIRELAGYDVRAKPSTGDKVIRAIPLAAQAEAKNVRLVEGPWNATYLNEMCTFPYGEHDDQVDPSSAAFNELALGPKPVVVRKAIWG